MLKLSKTYKGHNLLIMSFIITTTIIISIWIISYKNHNISLKKAFNYYTRSIASDFQLKYNDDISFLLKNLILFNPANFSNEYKLRSIIDCFHLNKFEKISIYDNNLNQYIIIDSQNSLSISNHKLNEIIIDNIKNDIYNPKIHILNNTERLIIIPVFIQNKREHTIVAFLNLNKIIETINESARKNIKISLSKNKENYFKNFETSIPLKFPWETLYINIIAKEKFKDFLLCHLLFIFIIFLSIIVHLTIHYYILSKKTQNKLAFLALHDSLTKLPNRLYFNESLTREIHRAKRHEYYIGLLLIDVNNFKFINDNYGHHTGDSVLINIAQNINKCTRKEDTVARLSGDEFVVIVPNIKNQKLLEAICQRLIQKFSSKMYISKDLSLNVSISIGAVISDAINLTPNKLIKAADQAMYSIKDSEKSSFKIVTIKSEEN